MDDACQHLSLEKYDILLTECQEFDGGLVMQGMYAVLIKFFEGLRDLNTKYTYQ